jgi:hypothetical protein
MEAVKDVAWKKYQQPMEMLLRERKLIEWNFKHVFIYQFRPLCTGDFFILKQWCHSER